MARANKIGGSGDYQSIVKSMKKLANTAVKAALTNGGSALGALVGGYGAGPVGAGVGGAAGKRLGARLSKMLGSGDYAVSADCAYNSLVRPGASQYASFSDSTTSVRLKHREYLQDAFTGPTANVFNNTTFEINPGLSSTFPFLAQIASNFEEYKMHGLVFEFVSTTSPYNSTSAMGSVIMAMEYNASAAPYTSKPQMENSDFAISARPDKSMLYGVECVDNATNHLFVRTGTGNLPLTTTDIGLFNFATLTPLAANTTLGEIWVTYDVELYRPKISPLRFGYFHATLSLPALVAAGTIVAGDYSIVRGPYTPVQVIATGSATDFAMSTDGTTTLTLAGADVGDVYMLTTSYTSIVAGQSVSNGLSTGLTGLSVFNNYTSTFCNAFQAATEASCINITIFQVTSISTVPKVTITTGSAVPAGGAIIDMVLCNIGNGFTASTL